MKNTAPTSNLDSMGKSKDKPRKFNTNNCLSELYTEKHYYHMSRAMRKPDFCLCINKGTDQLRGNHERPASG